MMMMMMMMEPVSNFHQLSLSVAKPLSSCRKQWVLMVFRVLSDREQMSMKLVVNDYIFLPCSEEPSVDRLDDEDYCVVMECPYYCSELLNRRQLGLIDLNNNNWNIVHYYY